MKKSLLVRFVEAVESIADSLKPSDVDAVNDTLTKILEAQQANLQASMKARDEDRTIMQRHNAQCEEAHRRMVAAAEDRAFDKGLQ